MKLTEEEQEKIKFENYEMMAAISGRNINDFIENNSKSNYNEKDCMIKLMYLKNMVYPISSRDLFETLKHQNYTGKYGTFCGMLNRYCKYEYVLKVNNKKPFLYQITELGNQHIKNPYLAREENIRRYKEFQLNKLKQLIEGQPELFKSIYESIFGVQQNNIINSIVNNSSQYSDYEIGNKDDVIEEIRGKIEDKTFFTNVNEDKLESLVNGLLNDSLSLEEKKDLIIDALYNAANANKGSITIKQQEYNSSKPIGQRKYYEYLVNGINHVVTRPLYEAIPFRFIKVGNQLRLKSVSEAGTYRNNKDASELDFDYVNRVGFKNQMIIKTKEIPEKRELEFYYVGGNLRLLITTMSFDDYTDIINSNVKTTLKINPAPKNN